MTDKSSNNVVAFNLAKLQKKKRVQKAKSKTLCKSGFHKWVVLKDTKFMVSKGRLQTTLRCEHCGKEKKEYR